MMYIATKDGKMYRISADQVRVWKKAGYRITEEKQPAEAPEKPKKAAEQEK